MQNDTKTISIVTPSLNQGEFIAETIESVLSQAGDFFIDYIIMDGCSTDGSVEIIAKYDKLLQEGKWPVKCRGITYRWRSELDDGQANAINKGFSLARGEIFAWLNSDDVYYADSLRKVSQINWEKTDFCYGKGMWISREGNELCRYPSFKPNRYSLCCKCTLCQPTVFFSKRAYSEIGIISQEYHCAFDYEFWVRATLKNRRFSFVPSFLAKSRMYHQNKSLSDQQRATRETAVIRHRYYAGLELNKVLLDVYSFVVEKITNRYENELFRKIGRCKE